MTSAPYVSYVIISYCKDLLLQRFLIAKISPLFDVADGSAPIVDVGEFEYEI